MTEESLKLSELSGVGEARIRQLKDVGINNIMDLLVRSPIELSSLTGMEKDTAENLVTKARQYLTEEGILAKDFITALEVEKHRESIGKISTSTKSLDELLGGGIETQAITEVYAEFGSGKTQFAHTICVMVQKPKEEGGLDGSVLYIDTENTFRPNRITSIAIANGLDPIKVKERIFVAKAYNSSHQILLLEECTKFIQEKNIKLIVVDSLTGLFRAEYPGMGTLAARQQQINHFVHLLSKIADTYNIAALVTNQVMASPGVFFGDPTRAIGGHIVAHTSTYRIYFRKSGKNRVAIMIDSPEHAQNEAKFTLGERGVQDIEDKKLKEKDDSNETV